MSGKDTMRAVEITAPGGTEVLRLVERPRPEPAAGEVLIEVHAAGVNRPDVLQRLGRYPPPPGVTDIPGLEVAGRVVACGEGVSNWRVGDMTCALVAGGGYADYVAAPAVQCLPVPAGLSTVEAAALPETTFTVWTNVFERGRLAAGETLLVHGGASGIGTMAIQMARAFGARVCVTAGTDEKCDRCLALGAELAIDYHTDWHAAVRDHVGKTGIDVVLDMVGGDYTAKNLDLLAVDGRLVQIAFIGGSSATIDLMLVMRRRLTVTGSTLRARRPAEKGAIAARLAADVWPHLSAGRIRPVIHATFPLARAADAHRLLEAGGHVGKIVLAE